MILFPNCKINLGLIITGKREDGFHNIETVFYPISLKDSLEILPFASQSNEYIADKISHDGITFTSSGIDIDGRTQDNLCVKAYFLLKRDFPGLPHTHIHLLKAIPIGAGLGGGSSDAAFTLLGLNERYGLGLSQAQLISYALQLGSDCPFFIINQPCLGHGRGELLEPVDVDLSRYQLLLINPGVHINTGRAFNQLNKANISSVNKPEVNSLKSIISLPVSKWKGVLHNEFEEIVFDKYPEVKRIKECLYADGAIYASMSGSGSSVYGLYEPNVNITAKIPGHYLSKQLFL